MPTKKVSRFALKQPTTGRAGPGVRATAFLALVLGGVGVLALTTIGHVRWVIPVAVYGLFLLWALQEFFGFE